jgi:hypothetical protein
MTPKRNTFPTALLLVGEGQSRKQATVRDVVLDVTVAPPGSQPNAGVADSFLNGSIRAEGELFEECRPGASLLAKGRQAVLKLTVERHWSLVSILIVDLGEIRSVSPKERLYQWKFLVVGKPSERLHLSGADPREELAIEDLLNPPA